MLHFLFVFTIKPFILLNILGSGYILLKNADYRLLHRQFFIEINIFAKQTKINTDS